MAFLELKGVTKQFGRVSAVDQIHLAVEKGELLTLLGPSGAGKTTTLRIVAGFESPNQGRILLDGEEITHRPASKRLMGVVFQPYALFPHLSVEENIAFGLRTRHLPKEYIKQRCAELLHLVGLTKMARHAPDHLSGGQQQRVALARALAMEPKVLLLDEPLSALDAKVRVMLRNEIRWIQQQLSVTTLYATHDQEEALAISDRIAVMSNGQIQQLDAPEVVYRTPRTAFAATFVGTSNQFRGVLESAAEGRCRVEDQTLYVAPQPDLHDGEAILVVLRPEELTIQHAEEQAEQQTPGPLNIFAGVIDLRTFLGPFTRFHTSVTASTTLMADIPSQQARGYDAGQEVRLSFRPEACMVLKAVTNQTS